MAGYVVIKRPLLTEKVSDLTERHNQVAFEVDKRSNKYQVRAAVEALYDVRVESVATMIVPGKIKRRGRSVGKRSSWKKALVTLCEGDSIDFYASE